MQYDDRANNNMTDKTKSHQQITATECHEDVLVINSILTKSADHLIMFVGSNSFYIYERMAYATNTISSNFYRHGVIYSHISKTHSYTIMTD